MSNFKLSELDYTNNKNFSLAIGALQDDIHIQTQKTNERIEKGFANFQDQNDKMNHKIDEGFKNLSAKIDSRGLSKTNVITIIVIIISLLGGVFSVWNELNKKINDLAITVHEQDIRVQRIDEKTKFIYSNLHSKSYVIK